jgi:hypothetical protein
VHEREGVVPRSEEEVLRLHPEAAATTRRSGDPGKAMKHLLGSFLVGGVIAAMIACGGGQKSAKTTGAAPAVNSDGGMAPPTGVHDPRIAKADAEITDAMQKLGVPRPQPTITCAKPPCMPNALGVKPTQDPKCVHGTSQTCTDNCALADSICDNADTICKIAKELANDSWANEKCASAETSCETARGKCCGCS